MGQFSENWPLLLHPHFLGSRQLFQNLCSPELCPLCLSQGLMPSIIPVFIHASSDVRQFSSVFLSLTSHPILSCLWTLPSLFSSLNSFFSLSYVLPCLPAMRHQALRAVPFTLTLYSLHIVSNLKWGLKKMLTQVTWLQLATHCTYGYSKAWLVCFCFQKACYWVRDSSKNQTGKKWRWYQRYPELLGPQTEAQFGVTGYLHIIICF